MFFHAHNFNQDVSKWDMSSVTKIAGIFDSAYAFNQDISAWDISSVTGYNSMIWMFDNTENLSDDNKCAIHSSFSSNDNWKYDWEEYCSD